MNSAEPSQILLAKFVDHFGHDSLSLLRIELGDDRQYQLVESQGEISGARSERVDGYPTYKMALEVFESHIVQRLARLTRLENV